LPAVFVWRGSTALDMKLCCTLPARAKRSLRLQYSPQYHCDAIANTDAIVRIYPKREVLAAFGKNPKAARAFVETLAQQVMNLRIRVEQRNIRSARGRVRHFLMLNVGSDRRTVKLRGTLKDLAAEIGLTHEALYRTLATLERSGEITRKGKTIVLSHRI
jgi:CRP-like cAMP-binding protein